MTNSKYIVAKVTSTRTDNYTHAFHLADLGNGTWWNQAAGSFNENRGDKIEPLFDITEEEWKKYSAYATSGELMNKYGYNKKGEKI